MKQLIINKHITRRLINAKVLHWLTKRYSERNYKELIVYPTIILATLLVIITAVFKVQHQNPKKLKVWGWAVIILSILIAGSNTIVEYQKRQDEKKLKPSDLVFWVYVISYGYPTDEEIRNINSNKRLYATTGNQTLIIELEPALLPDHKRAGRSNIGGVIYRFRSVSTIIEGNESITLEKIESDGIVFKDLEKSIGTLLSPAIISVFVRGEQFKGRTYNDFLKINKESEVNP